MHTTLLGLLLHGHSYMKLFFRAKGARPRNDVALFTSDERLLAWRCPRCGGLFTEQPPWFPGDR